MAPAIFTPREFQSLQSLSGAIMYYHEWDHQRDCLSDNPIPGNAVLRHLLGNHFYLQPYPPHIRSTRSSIHTSQGLTLLAWRAAPGRQRLSR